MAKKVKTKKKKEGVTIPSEKEKITEEPAEAVHGQAALRIDDIEKEVDMLSKKDKKGFWQRIFRR